MDGNDRFDELFRKKMEGGEAKVPEDAWASIQQNINSEERPSSKRKGMIPIPLVWLAASFLGGVGLSGAAFTAYYFNEQNIAIQKLAKQQDEFLIREKAWQDEWVKKNKEQLDIYKENIKEELLAQQATNFKVSNLRNSTNTISQYSESNNDFNNYQNETNSVIGRKDKVFNIENKESNFNFSSAENTNLSLANNNLTNHNIQASTKVIRDTIFVTDSAMTLAKQERAVSDVDKEKQKKSKKLFGLPVSIGMFISPEMSSRSIHFSNTPDPQLVDYKEKDQNKFGFSAGLSVDLHLNKKFFLQTGLQYWNVGDKNSIVLQSVQADTLTTSTMIPISNEAGFLLDSAFKMANGIQKNGFGAPNAVTYYNGNQYLTSSSTHISESFHQFVSTINNNYHYIGVPLVLGMKLGSSKVTTGVFSGLITNVLISPNKSVFYVYADTESPSHFRQVYRELDRVSLVYWGGMNIDYKVSKTWTLSISPNIKYSLTSVYKDGSTVKQLPYSLGIQIGCKYFLGN